MDIKTQWNVLAAWARARYGNSDRGASLVEYALLVALIAVVCIAAISFLGNTAKTQFSNVASQISGASSS